MAVPSAPAPLAVGDVALGEMLHVDVLTAPRSLDACEDARPSMPSEMTPTRTPLPSTVIALRSVAAFRIAVALRRH